MSVFFGLVQLFRLVFSPTTGRDFFKRILVNIRRFKRLKKKTDKQNLIKIKIM
jgi:hypothetical protein